MDSWATLESRFRSLAPALEHSRLDAQWGAAGEYWRVAGLPRTQAVVEFETLATAAGMLLATSGQKSASADAEPRVRWYRLLMKNHAFVQDRSGEQINEDGSSGGFIHSGSIYPYAEASANLCLAMQLEGKATEPKPSAWGKRMTWLHDNYGKTLVVAAITGATSIAAKYYFGL